MPIQSFEQWKTAQTSTPTTSAPVKVGKIQSFDEWKAAQPPAPAAQPGFLSKAVDWTKGAVKDVAQTVASPFLRIGATAMGGVEEALSLGGDLVGNKKFADQRHQNYLDLQKNGLDAGYLGKAKVINGPVDAIGVGLDAGANLIGAEGASSALKAGAKGFLKQSIKTGAKAGFEQGLIQGAGKSLQQDNPTVGGVISDTAKGAVYGTGAGGVLGGLLGGISSKLKKPVVEPKVTAAMDVVKNDVPKVPANPNWNQDLPLPTNPNPDAPYIPNEQLPTIQMGGSKVKPSISMDAPPKVYTPEPVPKVPLTPDIQMGNLPPKKIVKDNLPVIDYGGVTTPTKTLPKGMRYEPIKAPVVPKYTPVQPKPNGYTYEPISNNQTSPQTPEYKQPILSRTNQIQPPSVSTSPTQPPFVNSPQIGDRTVVNPTQTTSRLTPVEGTGTVKTRGLASSLEEKLQKSLGALPEYNVVGNEGQFKNVAEITATDLPRAKRIALGQEAPPAGTHPEAFYVAMSELAKNDPALALQLGKESSLISDSTTMGQRIQLLSHLNPDSLVNVIRDVQKSFDTASGKKYNNFKQVVKNKTLEIDSHIGKNVSKKEDWSSFIDSIKC